jgi:hypothetical protein
MITNAIDRDDVDKAIAAIMHHAGERPSGDIAGQLFYLNQSICLLCRIVVDLANWMAQSR